MTAARRALAVRRASAAAWRSSAGPTLTLTLTLTLAIAAGGGGAGCGGADRGPTIEVPVRTATAGDVLLALTPAGAEAVLEIDLHRLRTNPVVGGLARAILPGVGDEGGATTALIGAVEVVVFASFGLADGNPRTLVLARGGEAERLAGVTALGGGAVAIGDADLVARARAVAEGREPAVTSDRRLMALRTGAMPSAAAAAAVRLTAQLSFEARLSLARRLDLDAVPLTISVWADVVDDLAVLAVLGAEQPKDARLLERETGQLVRRLGRGAPLYGRMLSRELGRTRVDVRGAAVQLTLLIGPRRLASLVERAIDALGAAAVGDT